MKIIIETTIAESIDKIWECCPSAKNDLKEEGKFEYRMEAVDGSVGFDLKGIYHKIIVKELISYFLEDGRFVEIRFTEDNENVRIIESFKAENIHTIEQQREGWQAILENFRKYVESKR